MVPLAVAGGVAVTAGLSLYFAHTFNPRTTFAGCPQIARLPESRGNAIYLTFDDGPHPDTTPRILDALAAENARATFFVVGERATRYPQLVRRMVQEGHTVGVHGLHHRTMVLQTEKEIEHDLGEAVKRIEGAAGQMLTRPILLRPPYGFKTRTLARTAQRLGFIIVAWSLDPRDYDPIDAATLTAKLAARLVLGDIVLLHERPKLPVAIDALPGILAYCREKRLSPAGLIAVADFLHHPPAQAAKG
ncbi:MAG: polysaccharide deacetylase family protein [Fibrella sp.]|nr:polysaccharide deacetylase family protein [Armatimonadota bacterium]